MKIALLYVCTGQYVVFWNDFFDSFEKFFLKDYEKHYYVFTDSLSLYKESECNRIHRIYQENLGWPGNTLKKFHMFSKISEKLKKFDYIFFFNANAECVSEVKANEFLPIDCNYSFCQVPGWYKLPKILFPYEKNKKSMAYFPKKMGTYYLAGGLNGGKADAYLHMVEDLKKATDIDLKNGIIASVHDESHLNKFVIGRNDYRVISPEFLYPEGWELPYEPIIVLRDKDKVLNTNSLKNKTFVQRVWGSFKTSVRKFLQHYRII